MSALFRAIAVTTLIGYASAIGLICVLAALELVAPREDQMPMRDRIRTISFLFAYIPIALLTSALLRRAAGQIGLHVLFPGLGLFGVLVGAIVGDFLYYWYHRAQHAMPALWRIHATHHSIEKMGAGTGYHHLLDAPLRSLFVLLPATLLFGSGGEAAIIFTIHGFYVHSTTRVNFGRFAWIVCDNRVHRIHHSREREHYDRNFGVITLLWDRLFGTARFPAGEEWPPIGLDGHREPKTALAFFSLHQPRLQDPHVHEIGIEIARR